MTGIFYCRKGLAVIIGQMSMDFMLCDVFMDMRGMFVQVININFHFK